MRIPLTFFLLSLGTVLSAETVELFETLNHFTPYPANAVKTVRLEQSPLSGKQKITIAVNPADALPYVGLQRKWSVTSRMPFRQGNFRLELKLVHTAPAPFVHLPLHIVDIQGEEFQFRPVSRKRNADGSWIYAYDIREDFIHHNWGRNANKKFDFPICLAGISVNFGADKPEGKIYLESLERVPQGRKNVTSRLPLLRFEKGRNHYRTAAWNGSCAALTEGNRISFSGTAGSFAVVPHDWKERPFPAPSSVRVRLRTDKAGGTLGLKLQSASGEIVEVGAPLKNAGEKNLTLQIPDTLSGEVQFQSIQFQFPRKEPFRIELLEMEAVVLRSKAETLEWEIRTGSPLYILRPGKEKNLGLLFRNPSNERLAWKIKADFRDFYNRGFEKSYAIDLAPGESRRIPVTEPLKYRGIWQVCCTVVSPEEEKICAEKTTTFAYQDQRMWKNSPDQTLFRFGIVAHLNLFTKNEYDLALAALEEAGVDLLRIDANWDVIQPQADVWNFKWMDTLAADMKQRGILMNPILHPVPRWAAAEHRRTGYGTWSRSRPLPGTYEKFCETMANRYRENIYCWEIWNEADLIPPKTLTAKEYLEVLAEGARGIRKANPSARIATCGFGAMDHPNIQKDFQETVIREGKNDYDIHAFHEHGGFNQYAYVLDNQFFPMRKRAAVSAPWFSNETAATSVGGSGKAQALTLFKKVLFAWSRGSISYVWYNLRNKGVNPFNGEHNFGLMTYDFHPKAAFSAFSELSRLYSGMKFDRQLEIRPGQFVFRFHSPGTFLIGAWNEASNEPDSPVLFRTDAKRAFLADLMGNRTELTLNDGLVFFPVAAIPSSLLLTGATFAEPEPSALDLGPIMVIPGKEQIFKAAVRNPFRETLVFQMKLIPSPTLSLKQTDFKAILAPGQTITFPIAVTTSKERKAASLSAQYRFGTAAGTLNLPVASANAVSSVSLNRLPDYLLNNVNHVYDLYKADPRFEYRTWKGPKDLSAKVWLAREKEGLRIRIEAEDDRHHQPYRGVRMYLGDSVQLALQLPRQSGLWEIGFSLRNDGTPETFVWTAPSGLTPEKAMRGIKLFCKRSGTCTTYDAWIPFSALGTGTEILKQGFRANLLVNDNDGEGRDGWIFLAPGLGTTKAPDRYPFFVQEE